MKIYLYGLCLVLSLILTGCETSTNGSTSPPQQAVHPIVLLSVTSDASDNPQSVDMAMKLAGFSLDEGRQVVMFFNVKGVTIPTKDFDDALAFSDNAPIKEQLQGLIERGVDVHVCPICMKGLGVADSDIIEGAQVTTRPVLFSHIGAYTAVFTY